MYNALICINGSTPYQALYGRQPPMLPPLEGGYIEESELKSSGVSKTDLSRSAPRDQARVREIGAGAIIEATALKRLERADPHKTVPAVQRFKYEVGELVDIWHEPSHKEQSGWRGPAKIASINEIEGNITVKFQGRTLEQRMKKCVDTYPTWYTSPACSTSRCSLSTSWPAMWRT